MGSSGEADFEDVLEDALCVFKSGGSDVDLLKENDQQILFLLDLDNESIVEKSTAASRPNTNYGEEDAQGTLHPMMLNQYPLCKYHTLLLLFAEAGLPQVLSDELLVLVLQVFKMSNRSQLRIGYNSMGADCIVNNLHFHVLCTDDLYGNPDKLFPIETADKTQFFKTSLRHKNKDEINMYNCGVRFGEVLNFPMKALLISPMIDSDDTSLEDA
jgi:hypothetical protein